MLDARRLVTSLPDEWRKAVVVLVGVDTENLEGSGAVLTKSLRRLFRIPDDIPVTVSGSITTEASRSWLYDLMEGPPLKEHGGDEVLGNGE